MEHPRLALSFELVKASTTRYGNYTLELMQEIADFISVRVNLFKITFESNTHIVLDLVEII